MKLLLSHDQFLIEIANHLDYKPDSANFSLYQHFIDLIVRDTMFDCNSPYWVAFELSKLITTELIEEYDNIYDGDYSPIYNEVRKQFITP